MDNESNKKEFLDRFIMDKMIFPSEKESQSSKGKSLNKLLAELDEFQSEVDLKDSKWVKGQKISVESLRNAYDFLTSILKTSYPAELKKIIKRHDLIDVLKIERTTQSPAKKKGVVR